MITNLDDPQMKALLGRKVVNLLTTRMVCQQCSRSRTVPTWDYAECGACQRCGCTSFDMEDGRPVGPRHRRWQDEAIMGFELSPDGRVTEKTLMFFTCPDELDEIFVLSAVTLPEAKGPDHGR